MQVKVIPSRWLRKEGLRFDCGPYMSGALDARELLSAYNAEPLHSLTNGYNGGIYNGPQFVRNYVVDPDHGVPFITTSTMLQADLSRLPMINRKDAYSSKLSYLRVEAGMTLITCSGSIGRMVYARNDMEGCWSNQDIMKVVADETKIHSGYLYAFLSSKFGVPLVVSGTYGAIIQHIEPHHIADLPVPRLGDDVEDRAHELVQKAAEELSESSALLSDATMTIFHKTGLNESRNEQYLSDTRRTGWVEKQFCYSSLLQRLGWSNNNNNYSSLRALNFDLRSSDLKNAILTKTHSLLGDIVDRDNFEGHIVFTRIDADPEYGVMLVGQREAFQMRPSGRWISKKSIEGLGLQVPPGTTVIPCHGTLGESELYCRATLVTERTSSYAYSGDFYRCIPLEGAIRSGYLFAFLRSRYAFRMMRAMSTGGKQQYQHPSAMANMPIPRLATEDENIIADKVDRAAYLRDHALELEDQARALVEHAIEEGGH